MKYKMIIYNYYNNVVREIEVDTEEEAIKKAKFFKEHFTKIKNDWNGWIAVEDDNFNTLYWCDKTRECKYGDKPF